MYYFYICGFRSFLELVDSRQDPRGLSRGPRVTRDWVPVRINLNGQSLTESLSFEFEKAASAHCLTVDLETMQDGESVVSQVKVQKSCCFPFVFRSLTIFEIICLYYPYKNGGETVPNQRDRFLYYWIGRLMPHSDEEYVRQRWFHIQSKKNAF